MDGREKIAGHIYDRACPCFTQRYYGEQLSQFSEITPVPAAHFRSHGQVY